MLRSSLMHALLALFASSLVAPGLHAKVQVDPLTPEQEQQEWQKLTTDFQRRGKVSQKDLAKLSSKLDSLGPDEKSRLIEILAEIDERREELRSGGVSAQQREKLRDEMRELHHEFRDENHEFAEMMRHVMGDPRMRADISREMAGLLPNSGRWASLHGKDLLESGEPEAAAQEAQRALALDPKSTDSYVTLAEADYKLGDFDGAYDNAKRAYELNPKDQKSLSLMRLAESRRGAGASEEQGSLKPPPPMPQAPAPDSSAPPQMLLAREGPPAGMILADKAERSLQFAAQAELRLKARGFDDAVRLSTKALDENPENLHALFVRAAAHIWRNDWASARQDVEAALGIQPKNVQFRSLYSRIFSHDKDYQRALEEADTAIALDPSFAEAHFNKALAQAGLNRREQAMASLKEAARLSPGQYKRIYERALALEASEDLAAMLSGEASGQAAAAPAARPSRATGRLLAVGMACLVGGFLIALGLLQALAGGWARRFKTALTGGAQGGAVLAGAGRAPLAGEGGSVALEAGPGTLVADVYEVRKKIGAGGMGLVYEALDRRLERRVAVKKMREEIRADPREAARFLQEARMVAKLRHPNVVEIYAIVEDGPDIYLVFEFVDGKTVHRLIDEQGKLPFAQALGILRGACAALEYAHGRGVIHRDLKPANIMITPEGLVKVMDFGVARQAQDSMARLSTSRTVVGTPPYMAPEQEQGAVCKESDLYALAVCLYEMVTGDMPFSGAGAEMLLCKMNKTYPPASGRASLPPGFDAFLSRALEPDPARRIRTPAEFLRQAGSLA